ncbi:MAG: ABC transporter substrate-binding protein [Proteobacteria bacterium]|nr:ABC transporter substrate-binding protein [Pseudomonadota bacterium]
MFDQGSLMSGLARRSLVKGGLVIFILTLFSSASLAASASPDVLVRDTTNEILLLLRKNHKTYKKDTKKLYAMVHEKILPHFDFTAMSRMVLARNWRSANEEQRSRFTTAFRDLLVRTYATALLKYTNEEIAFLAYHAKPDDRKVIVKTEIRPAAGGPAIPLYYRFYDKKGTWKVFDVSIDGVSMVTNYRSVYAEKVRKQGLDALIVKISRENTTDKKAEKVK